MRVIALSTLKAFWEANPEYADAKEPALAWYRHTLHADWSSPVDVKADFGNASVLRDGRVVFNVGGNKYRLVVWINYPYRVVYVRFIGTHFAQRRGNRTSTTVSTRRRFEGEWRCRSDP